MTLIDKAEALLPCPLCGKTPEPPVDATRILGVWRVIHKGCTTLPNFSVERAEKSEAIAAWNRRAALPARGVGVKPLVFRDETGDGVLTSRETGELFRIFPQHDGVFFAPKLPEGENTASDAQTLIDRYNARWSARILAALAPTDAAQAREAALRLRAYMDRRKRAHGFDQETVHTFDAGTDSEANLTVADLEAILALIGEPRK